MDIDTIENNDESTALQENNKNKMKSRGKKRKRRGSNSSSESGDVLPENALEVEHNLIASAVKNNLDDVSVKKILKKVVTNDHVLALVKLREEEEKSNSEQSGVTPKLTRAKVKELMKESPNTAPWNLEKIELTPIKHIPVKTRPEVKALIAQELPEDEDDDEYQPNNDEVPSDDDQGLESCSDIDSQPRTPATPRGVSRTSPKVVKDGPFKVPQELSTPIRRKLDMDEEEATIALRTRSKLSLSETPIEHIESSFVPPDELPIPPVDDHLWNDFLNECLNPASVSRNEDDDETDPEYNVAADPDAHDEDEEALENTIIKISKKELSDLVTELFNIMPETTVDDELTNMANSVLTEQSHNETSTCWEGKQEPVSDEERPLKIREKLSFERRNSINKMSIGKSEPVDEVPCQEALGTEPTTETQTGKQNVDENQLRRIVINTPQTVVRLAVEEHNVCVMPAPLELVRPLALQIQPAEPIVVTIDKETVILPEQILILQQQLRMHVQLATSNFLQLFVNPLHWTMAPTYKEYLMTLVKMSDANPQSVVGVCNLRPALELVEQWELTVAKDTPENTAMVAFIQKEAEKWRRCMAQNRPYVGVFHETFSQVVANSTVFLYPYLLPPIPFGADFRRRFSYLHSEDKLIALGLDQFWQYVESNPEMFPKPGKSHPRHRWGLQLTTELLIKHMLPWQQPRALMAHIMAARRQKDKENPISKFFATNKVEPVKHKLLPFNPKLTLYEQPEHEIPPCWLKYLAKTSQRFKLFNRGRRQKQVKGQEPTGVDVIVGATTEPLPKQPLSIDFTKEIRRATLNPSPPRPVLADKFDIDIEKRQPQPLNIFKLVPTSQGHTLVPVTVTSEVSIASEAPHVTETSIQSDTTSENNLQANKNEQTTTVDSNVAPISSTIEFTNAPKSFEKKSDKNHCSCCKLLREICKVKQTVITDFFSSKNKNNVNKRKCECNFSKYPTITKRLKLLIRRYKYNSKLLFEDVMKKLKIRKSVNDEERRELDANSEEYTVEDMAYVTAFQMKLTIRASVARNALIKGRVNSLFTRFDLDWGDPIKLAIELEQSFGLEMVDMLKEFVGFLNPLQADRINNFKDYFIHNCVEDLVKRIEEQVNHEETKLQLLSQISAFFSGRDWSPCEMCTSLLSLLRSYPTLARYTFGLFPHAARLQENEKLPMPVPANTSTRVTRSKSKVNGDEPATATTDDGVDNVTATDYEEATMDYEERGADDDARSDPDYEIQGGVNYEADHSSSASEEDTTRHVTTPAVPETEQDNDHTKPEINTKMPEILRDVTTDIIVTKTEIQDYSDTDNSMSMTIMSEDEYIKSEPLEWKREEDKLILEMLKQHLTPEERQDKTILEIIEEKRIVQILTESLPDKSVHEVKERVINILRLLVMGEL